MRVLSGKAAERAVTKLERRASRLEKVEPAVRAIVRGVRREGDLALRRYATLWDGLPTGLVVKIGRASCRERVLPR